MENGGSGIETRDPLALTLTSTEEDGAGWAAQRTGRRLVVGGLEAFGGDGAPGREHARRDPSSGDR